MSKRGLPQTLKMRHDLHYVEELTQSNRFIGRIIPINKIEPNPEQPRVEMGDLSELISSIKEKGVLEPLLVKPLNFDKWLIIAGERRWRAAQFAGLTELPCVELNVDEREVAEIALIENLQRKDLTIWEEADAYAALCEKFSYKHEDLAKKLGKSRSSVTETLTIASLPFEVKEKCIEAGIISKAAILKIARQFDESEMLKEVKRISKPEPVHQANAPSESSISEKASLAKSQTTHRADQIEIRGEVSQNFPVRIFKYQDVNQNFKLVIKFRKTADKETVRKVLEQVLANL